MTALSLRRDLRCRTSRMTTEELSIIIFFFKSVVVGTKHVALTFRGNWSDFGVHSGRCEIKGFPQMWGTNSRVHVGDSYAWRWCEPIVSPCWSASWESFLLSLQGIPLHHRFNQQRISSFAIWAWGNAVLKCKMVWLSATRICQLRSFLSGSLSQPFSPLMFSVDHPFSHPQ